MGEIILLMYLRMKKSSVGDGMREQDREGEERKSHSVRLTNPNVNIDTVKTWGGIGLGRKKGCCLLDRVAQKKGWFLDAHVYQPVIRETISI